MSTADGKKEWTIMIYMAGDNNLSEDMIRAIREMRRIVNHAGPIKYPPLGGVQNEIEVIVEFDGQHPRVPNRRYRISYVDGVDYPHSSRPIEQPGSVINNFGIENPSTKCLKSFVEESMTSYPARNFGLILSGHSDAFLGRSLLLDENPTGVTSLQDIVKILSDIQAKPEPNGFPNGKLDLLSFDGCVMNTIEVLSEFKEVVHTTIGSQGSIPNFTWDYGKILEVLTERSDLRLTKDELISIIKESIAEYNKDFAFGGRSVDFSSIELSALDEVAARANKLAFAMVLLLFAGSDRSLEIDPKHYVVRRLLDAIIKAHWNCQTFLFDQMVDIKDLCDRLGEELEKIEEDLPKMTLSADKILLLGGVGLLKPYIVDLKTSIDSKLVSNGTYVGSGYQFVNGLSVYFPWSVLGFYMVVSRLEKLSFAKNAPWFIFLLSLLVILTARPEQNVQLLPLSKEGKRFGTINEILNALYSDVLGDFSVDELLADSDMPKIAAMDWLGASKKAGINDLTIEIVNQWLNLQPALNPPNTKLNPPNTKGLDVFYEYFGATTNIYPKLNIRGDFPPNLYRPTEIPGEEIP